MSTDPGDIVLDSFLGTGTTAIAAKALGRHYIGFELDPMYKKIADDKLAKVESSMYNGYYVSYYLGKLQSIRDVDAAQLFPPQLTSTEKKLIKANGNGHKPKEKTLEPIYFVVQPTLLQKKATYVEKSEDA
jgi:tRNA G10  N-methylase Trm11